ncbi:hypothetical protein D9O50_03745 [Oxalobacteraceae bacterium CAVE-383]|nr:hypothetical protein D9O50_03745 [Oxalobacteraceae bacterium CAVE-383]
MPPDLQSAAAVTALPPTASLLVLGGDQRIAIQPGSQVNKYGCQPFPAADRIAFGSSTASQISAQAFDAADRLRTRIAGALADAPAATVYRAELMRLRGELLDICGLAPPVTSEDAAPDVIFAASGTDAHLLASHLTAAQAQGSQRSLRVIMVNPEESGSGVSTALSGRSFSAYNALGDCGPHADARHEVTHVAIRDPGGAPRSPQSVADDVAAQSDAALRGGSDVLLVLIDVSKTGCVAPEPVFALQLQQRAAGRVHILVDACQFRIETATLRAYLAQGFMVAVTGSKFIGGPSFSAALLIPPALAARMRPAGAPPQLERHSALEEWPAAWHAERTLSSSANPGLLLRWEAALHELKAFKALPGAAVRKCLLRFNAAVQARLQSDPHFEALPAPAMPGRAAGLAPEWDDLASIHPFTLYRPQAHGSESRQPLDTAQVAHVYRQLQQQRNGDGFIYSVGQPVVCGRRDGVEYSVLRLCIGAGMVVQACGDPSGAAGDALIAHAMACLDAIAGLISTTA